MWTTGDVGLEIAPGKDVDDNPDLHIIGNIWNAVPTAKTWTPLDPIEGAITVNIGDGLQYWTDGLFKSTYHRVRAPKDGDNKVSMPSSSSTAKAIPTLCGTYVQYNVPARCAMLVALQLSKPCMQNNHACKLDVHIDGAQIDLGCSWS